MEALFKLLRIALGNESDLSVPEGADWPALVALATEQGVAALAHDGLQKCYDANPRLVLPLDRELKAVKYDWFGATLNVEIQCEKQWEAVTSLGALFAERGLRTLVLKGFALSECYPVPQHRYSCDFDCFLMGGGPVTDRRAFEKGNRVMEAAGAKVDRSFYKHSSAKFKETKVENHLFLVGWRGSARWKRFELELERMLEAPGALRPLSDTALLVGPPLFNALFLTRHAHVHFLIEEGISLRHVCDWAVFLKRYGPELDWDAFMGCCARYGLSDFVGSMTRLASHVCGLPLPAPFATGAASASSAPSASEAASASEALDASFAPEASSAPSASGAASASEALDAPSAPEASSASSAPSAPFAPEVTSGSGATPADSLCASSGPGAAPADSLRASSGSGAAPAVIASADLTPADRRLLDDILALGQRSSQPKTRLGMALRILRSGWKFRAFSDETRLGCLLRYVWGYFFVKDLKLS